MDLHVCIKIDDDAVDKIARVVTATVKRVAEAQQVGAAQPPAPGVGEAALNANAPVLPYSAQIAQAVQQPVQNMAGQAAPVSQPQHVPTAAPVQPGAAFMQPTATTPAVPVQAASVPTASHAYTLDELAGAAMLLMDRGMQTQLQDLLAGYGVESLPMLPPEQYGNFATALRGMGAQI